MVLAILAASVPPSVTASADDAVAHRVTYTVTADRFVEVDIYYRDVDPPNWADYSHNPYEFSPKAEASLAPGRPWVREVTLADPGRWAMVAVSGVSITADGTIGCELAVDGVVVEKAHSPVGTVCSLRHW